MVVEAEMDFDRGRGICSGTVDLPQLPEGCIANVLSFTTPRDACRLSLVSSTFRSAAQSDAVWGSFLPPDYQTIISHSSDASTFSFSSKKEIYFSLCEKPLLIDEGKKSFLLDKKCGKKCYMLSARILSIVWGDTPRYWRWTSLADSRFAEVAELISVCWLEIRGWINTGMLSPATLYAAYLVFKTTGGAYGFDYQAVEVSVGIVGEESNRRTVYLDVDRGSRVRCQIVPRRAGILSRARLMGIRASIPSTNDNDVDRKYEYPKQRSDGWLEIELGEFFNQGGQDKQLEMGVYEIKGGDWKGGLVVQGIELRPKFI